MTSFKQGDFCQSGEAGEGSNLNGFEIIGTTGEWCSSDRNSLRGMTFLSVQSHPMRDTNSVKLPKPILPLRSNCLEIYHLQAYMPLLKQCKQCLVFSV